MQIYKDEHYLLGNASLHLQLSAALGVMTHLISNRNHPPAAAHLAETLELPVRHLRKLLRLLVAGDLLRPHPSQADTWICAGEPHQISLADIYRCLLIDTLDSDAMKTGATAPSASLSPSPSTPPSRSTMPTSTDLLMMQATMTVNQVVLQHLQQFDLGRLKIAESALSFTESLRSRGRSSNGRGSSTDSMRTPADPAALHFS